MKLTPQMLQDSQPLRLAVTKKVTRTLHSWLPNPNREARHIASGTHLSDYRELLRRFVPSWTPQTSGDAQPCIWQSTAIAGRTAEHVALQKARPSFTTSYGD
eukprot:1617738-Amphidinium_carterae.1